MLREIRSPGHQTTPHYRRWFSDADTDLFIWFRQQIPTKFQLSIGKRSHEYAISWERERGYSLSFVDAGENRPGKYKMSPLLIPYETGNLSQLARQFLAASVTIDTDLADFVFARLLEHPNFRAEHSNQDTPAADLRSV